MNQATVKDLLQSSTMKLEYNEKGMLMGFSTWAGRAGETLHHLCTSLLREPCGSDPLQQEEPEEGAAILCLKLREMGCRGVNESIGPNLHESLPTSSPQTAT